MVERLRIAADTVRPGHDVIEVAFTDDLRPVIHLIR
jgi:hypothetical protein